MVKISIQNITDHDIRLAGKTELGTMQSMKSVLPTAVSHDATTVMISEVQKTTNANEGNSEELWDPSVDVSHLHLHQQNKVKQLLQ